MHHITMRGAVGEIRYVYHRAATLGAWSMDGGQLTAQVISHDAFRLSQQPLTFVVSRAGGVSWCWPLTGVHLEGTSLQATVGVQQ